MKRIIYKIVLVVSIFVVSNKTFAWNKYSIGDKVNYKSL